MSLKNTHTRLTGHPDGNRTFPGYAGSTFNGIGEPIDDLGPIVSKLKRDVNGLPLNPSCGNTRETISEPEFLQSTD